MKKKMKIRIFYMTTKMITYLLRKANLVFSSVELNNFTMLDK